MLLKKQTVWLLTMLSLVVVLSVYYITSPEQQQNELAVVDEKAGTRKNRKELEIKNKNPDTGYETQHKGVKVVKLKQMKRRQRYQRRMDAVDKDEEIITNAAGDEVFETTAYAIRRREKSNEGRIFNRRLASTELSAEERSEAKEQMDELNEIAQKELLLETLIKGNEL